MTPALNPIPFWFLRHGETDWNAQGLSQGRTDIPLNAIGLMQAARAAEAMRGRGIATIVASPLDRAYRTAEIVAQAKKHTGRQLLSSSKGEVLHSSFPPTVEVYHELSMQRTIVEVQAYDQIGLLYQLAKTISDHGFDITFARIGTERGVAIDTFYIESADHAPIEGNGRLHALRDALAVVIAPAAPAPAAAAGA